MSTPTIDRPTQRSEALEKANDVRQRRAGLKRDIKAGRLSVAAVVIDPPQWLLSARVFDLLLALPHYGRVRVNRILRSQAISPHKTVGGLSQRQREALVSVLGGARTERG